MRRPTCSDAFAGDRRCTKPPDHPGYHSDGHRFWRYEGEPREYVATWVARIREGSTSLARDETRVGL